FTWDALDGAATALERMRQGVHGLPSAGQVVAALRDEFRMHVDDDLNLPRALAVAWKLLRGDVASPADAKATLLDFDRVLGLGLATWQPRQTLVPERVQALAEERRQARAAKNWAEADRLRAALHAAGWEMEDAGED